MKKILFLLFALTNTMLLAADQNQAMLKGLGESSDGAAGASGVFMVHGFFFGPIIIAGLVASMIVFGYYKMLKQKDDGIWKAVGFFIIGGVLLASARYF